MASFGFSEEQELFRRQVREFAQKELAPGARERAKRGEVDLDMLQKMAGLGLLSMNAPAKYGGEEVSWVNVGIAIEELAKVDFTLSVWPIMGGGFLGTVLAHAPEELQDRWFPPILGGKMLPCLCLTEPDCGSDAVAIKTRAVRDGDHYIITGEKTSVSWGMQAKLGVLFAKTDPGAGARGVSCFLVPLEQTGLTRSFIPDLGWPSARRASISFDEVRLPADHRMGEEGQGFYLAMGVIGVVRVALTLQAIGHAEGALGEAISYARQRTAFGRPIAKFEAVSFKIAEQATILESARLLCYRALSLRDQGLPNNKEAAMAKWYGARSAVNACHEALLIHGHVGYSEEYPVEQRLKNVIGTEIGDGTAEMMKLIISREIIGRDFEPL
ncbi:acyl-CoA dehydrogenase family protein [Chloroflexota bacterium]